MDDMTQLRIGTYNVQAFRGYPETAARASLGRGNTAAAAMFFASVFSELECDILSLQEGVTDRQIARVADRLRLRFAIFPSPLHWPGHLLTHYPITEIRQYAPPRAKGSRRLSDAEARPFSRMAGAARLTLPGALLWVMSLHLHPHDPLLRSREAALVAGHVCSLLKDTPRVVVLGDFNCEPGETIHRELAALGFVNAMTAVGGVVEPTFDTTARVAYQVDHIYVSPALASKLVTAYTVRDPGFYDDELSSEGGWLYSDHVPVIAELGL